MNRMMATGLLMVASAMNAYAAGIVGEMTEEQEQRMQQQADNWRRNGDEERANDIEAQLEEENWKDEMERFGHDARAWQEEQDRRWAEEHGVGYIIDGPTATPAEPPAPPVEETPPSSDGGAGDADADEPPTDGGDGGQTPPPPTAPVTPPAPPQRWGDYWNEEGRGGYDAGGIRDLLSWNLLGLFDGGPGLPPAPRRSDDEWMGADHFARPAFDPIGFDSTSLGGFEMDEFETVQTGCGN